MITRNISISDINTNALRFDSSFHLSTGITCRREILHCPYGLENIGENTSKIFYGNRAKRLYVKQKKSGLPFLSSSEILTSDFKNVKLVSKRHTKNVDDLILEYGWTLITRSGTVGKTAWCTQEYVGKLASDHVIRVVPNDRIKGGCLYAYLSSKYGYSLLTQGMFGAVIQSIDPKYIASLPIPIFPRVLQDELDKLIQNASRLRDEAAEKLRKAFFILEKKADLPELSTDDYDFYGLPVKNRTVSTFTINKKDISSLTINAFNYSQRVNRLKKKITCATLQLKDVIKDGAFFSTGSFPRVEVSPPNGIMLINQSDIFDTIIRGKHISLRGVKTNNLVDYGEVLIAGVGTLGENESFCRAIFANEDIEGQLISGEFIRMKANGKIPSGYLYTWLNSEYGFRLIRQTQAGTKLCRPIQKLLLTIPVPVIDQLSMNEIDLLVREAHTYRHQANQLEIKAISMIEQEIEKWNN